MCHEIVWIVQIDLGNICSICLEILNVLLGEPSKQKKNGNTQENLPTGVGVQRNVGKFPSFSLKLIS